MEHWISPEGLVSFPQGWRDSPEEGQKSKNLPETGRLRDANQRFHSEYEIALERAKTKFGRDVPVVLVVDGKLVTYTHGGVREEVALVPEIFHKYKALAHQVVATWLRGLRLEGKQLDRCDRAALLEQHAILEASLGELEGPTFKEISTPETRLLLQASLDFIYRALSAGTVSAELIKEYAKAAGPIFREMTVRPTRALLDNLHSHMQQLKSRLPQGDWEELHVVLSGSRQARAGDATYQYFSRAFGERPGVGASSEDRILFLEGQHSEDRMLNALAHHIVDGELGEAFFHNKFALQRDVLADAAEQHLTTMFEMQN